MQTENEIQAAFFQWLALHEQKHPELGLFYAIPNGANKSPAARGLFKRTGLKAGVPDVHLPVRSRTPGSPVRIGLWIEFKSPKGLTSLIQKQWLAKLILKGHSGVICRSWTEAADITIDYLNLNIPKFNANSGSTG